ncbi:MAG: zf-HC2 domain-containing protein, partial [Armatimonadota bacterium]
MDCSKATAKLSAYVDGELDEHTLEAVEAHLATCADCQRELAALRALLAASTSVRSLNPPRDLTDRIRESVRRASVQDRRCARVAGLLSAYVDGELSAKQAELVEAHASFCERCAAEIAAIRRISETVRQTALSEPPAELRARIFDAIAREPARTGRLATAHRWLINKVRPQLARLAYAGI